MWRWRAGAYMVCVMPVVFNVSDIFAAAIQVRDNAALAAV